MRLANLHFMCNISYFLGNITYFLGKIKNLSVSVPDGARVYGANNRIVMTNCNSIKCMLSTVGWWTVVFKDSVSCVKVCSVYSPLLETVRRTVRDRRNCQGN